MFENILTDMLKDTLEDFEKKVFSEEIKYIREAIAVHQLKHSFQLLLSAENYVLPGNAEIEELLPKAIAFAGWKQKGKSEWGDVDGRKCFAAEVWETGVFGGRVGYLLFDPMAFSDGNALSLCAFTKLDDSAIRERLTRLYCCYAYRFSYQGQRLRIYSAADGRPWVWMDTFQQKMREIESLGVPQRPAPARPAADAEKEIRFTAGVYVLTKADGGAGIPVADGFSAYAGFQKCSQLGFRAVVGFPAGQGPCSPGERAEVTVRMREHTELSVNAGDVFVLASQDAVFAQGVVEKLL